MVLPVALNKNIVDFLTSLPNINDNNSLKAFINSAALDFQLQRQINFAGSSAQFFDLLVPQLIQYGQLEDGRNALETVLETAKNYVGPDRKENCDRLLQELRAVSNVEKHSPETIKGSPTSRVQLLLEGEMPDFNKTKRHDLVNVIAALLEIDRQFIRILHVNPGSIRVVIELPFDSAIELVVLFKAKSERVVQLLHQFFVKSIKILEIEEPGQLLPQQPNTPGLTWLHLSDWHQKDRDFKRKEVRDALIDDIENRTAKISPELKKIDFIVFSGDVAFHGKSEEYKTAIEEFFDPLLKATKVKRNRLFIVPGNHDLNREELKRLPEDLLDKFIDTPKEIEDWLKDKDARNSLLQPMKDYRQFMKSYLLKSNTKMEPAYAYVRRFTVNKKEVALVGLNSAWLCARYKEKKNGTDEVNDYGRLFVGELQLAQALKKASNADVKIAVLHHPFDCLITTETISEKSRIRERLSKECHFILHGHEHEPKVTVRIGTIGDCAIISAGACYDRPEPVASRYTNGYNFVHLNFTENRGTVYFRRYEERQGWLCDTGTTGDETPGSSTFPLPKKLGSKSSGLVREDSFKWKFPFEPELFVDRETGFLEAIQKEGEKPYLEFIGIPGSGKSELLKWICYHDSSEKDYLAAYVNFRLLSSEDISLRKDIFLVLEIILEHLPDRLSQGSRSIFQKNLLKHREVRKVFLSEQNPAKIKQLEDKLFITFNDILKNLLQVDRYKVVFCLDNVDEAPENIFEVLENRILENLTCYENFMLVMAGREQINWKNEKIKTRIGDRAPHEIFVLPKEGVLKQLKLLSTQKRFGLEDSTSIRERLYEFTYGHVLSNYRLINLWTKGFTFPLSIDMINNRQSLYAVCNFFIQELEQHLEKKQLADKYPPVLEMLAYFAVLRNIDASKLFFMFPVFFKEKCKEKDYDYFKIITDVLTEKQFHILLPLSRPKPPQNNLQPIVRYVVLKIKQISLLDLLEKIKKGYDTLIESPQSTPLKQIEYIAERLYHSGQYLSVKSFNQGHSNGINTSLKKELDIYLEKYFRNAKADLLEKFIQHLYYLKSDEKKGDTPLSPFSVDVSVLQQRVRDFQDRVKTCQS